MRFGKRSRNPLLWGRREDNTAEAPVSEAAPIQDEEIPSDEPEDDALPELPLADNVVPMRDISRQAKEDRMNRTAPAGNEPTQRLLTALGRFQRQYLIAQDGAPQDRWSDECMNYLISAVEISLEQGWADLVEALTETARILQSYEDVGRANLCVPFLADSYEILCLMVGDMIAGRVRPAVLQKWRGRYQDAIEDLRDAGIPLVTDEDTNLGDDFDDAPAASTPDFADEPSPEPVIATDAPFDMPPDVSDAEEDRRAEIPSLDDLSPLLVDPASMESEIAAMSMTSALDPIDVESDEYEGATAEVSPAAPWDQAGDSELDPLDMMPLAPLHGASEPTPATPANNRGLSPSLVGFIDILCDGLSRMEDQRADADLEEIASAMRHSLDLLSDRAEESGRNGALAATRSMRKLCEGAFDYPNHWNDRFFELAYAYGGVYADASDDADDSALLEWISECDSLLADWQIEDPRLTAEPEVEVTAEPEEDLFEAAEQNAFVEELAEPAPAPAAPVADAMPFDLEPLPIPEMDAIVEAAPDPFDNGVPVFEPVAEAPAPVETPPAAIEPPVPSAAAAIEEYVLATDANLDDDRAVEGEGNSFLRLLETAQAAAAKGSAVDAKLLAMQAAASIAKQQAEEAEARVRAAEVRLRESTASIETARERVQIAEQTVQVSERRVSEGEESLIQRKMQTSTLQNDLESAEGRVSDLDAQIRELIAQREVAERQRQAMVARREEARAQEDEAQARLERLNEEEQRARVRLEDARQETKSLQRRRMELEAALERARDLLQRQRASVTDIEQTIQHIRSAEHTSDTGKDPLLF